jgi:DNA-binding SARP family transcriptional activator
MKLDIKVLDRISAEIEGREVRFGDRKQRIVLAVLALDGKIVTKNRLKDLLWEAERLPQDPDAQIQGYIRDLRRAFNDAAPGSGTDRIRTLRGVGYQLKVSVMEVDYQRFRLNAGHASSTGPDDPEAAVKFGRKALAEWGAPAGLRSRPPLEASEPQLQNLVRAMQIEHQEALLACLEAELVLGRHRELIPQLAQLAGHDMASAANEALARLRMLACHRAGDDDQALEVYEGLASALDQIYGKEPAKETKQLKFQIQRRDPELQLPDSIREEDAGPAAAPDPAAAPEETAAAASGPAPETPQPQGAPQLTFNNLSVGSNILNQGYHLDVYGRESRGKPE